MIDFDALLLGPAMDTFARPITVTPLKSQPAHPPYAARGVWSSKPVDVQLENGSVLSSQDHTLGIRAAEFSVSISQGDQIEIPAHMSSPRLGIYTVEDGDDDGQGGTMLSLKWIAP